MFAIVFSRSAYGSSLSTIIFGFFSSYHFEGKGYFDPAIYIYPTSDNVPRSYLEEKEMECMAKDETIRVIIAQSSVLLQNVTDSAKFLPTRRLNWLSKPALWLNVREYCWCKTPPNGSIKSTL